MSNQEFKRIGVVGAGTMGRGIAHLFALHGFSVVLADREETVLGLAMERILERTDQAQREKVAGCITTSIDLRSLAGCDLVIEAVFEDETVKKDVYASLGSICRSDAVIASNTSAIPISRLALSLPDPSRFIGMHFMNPPVKMQLIEVVRGEKTADATVRSITGLAERLGKVAVVVADVPGFIANRLLFAQFGEALRLLESGAAAMEDIDTVMKLGFSHPLGPFALADFIGLDVCRQIMEFLRVSLGDERYRPGELLERLVAEGKLGRKSGEGFYQYT
ncbi:MAG TPA: 3-hydroxyacyl-CoA dehydrogenase family protein [Geobacteraceae bacterium]|nr:3-hydroxyacyl-CoA dehydrogenase family protein [Geobacteraceae bacterium]